MKHKKALNAFLEWTELNGMSCNTTKYTELYMSCPQIWNIEQVKDREKEKVGGRPAKLNEKKGNWDI